MLAFSDKIAVLRACLLDIRSCYADSYKIDIYFYFHAFEDIEEEDVRFDFLNNLHSKEAISTWVDKLTSKIVLHFNEEEEELSDFIFYSLS